MLVQIRKSLRDRLALQFLLLTTLTITCVTFVSIIVAGAHIRQRVIQQLALETSTKEDQIEQRLKQDWDYASLWSKQITQPTTQALDAVLLSAQQEGIPLLGVGVIAEDGTKIRSVGLLPDISFAQRIGGGIPVVTNEGWIGHVVLVPFAKSFGQKVTYFVGYFDMRSRLASLFQVSSVGETAELLFGAVRDDKLYIVQNSSINSPQNISLGSVNSLLQKQEPLAKAVFGQEGVERIKNYNGRDVYAAYKYIPRLGWGVVLTLNVSEAMIGVWTIGFSIVAVGLLLLGMALLLAASFSTRLTAPLQKIARNMEKLGPDNWQYNATIRTQDEIELVDTTVADMAFRLRGLYENLEHQVQSRTRELHEQYEIDKAILASAVHGVVLVAPDGHIMTMNPAAQEYLCKGDEACQEKPVLQIFKMLRKDEPLLEKDHPILQCLRTGIPVTPQADVLWNLQNTAGEIFAIDLTVTPVINENTIIGAVAVFRDVTEERHVDEVKSEFITLASHQLRTPLSVLKWYSELLEDDGFKSNVELRNEYLREIRNAGNRMSNLVDALLQAAQLESKGILAEKEKVNMNTFIADMQQELKALAKDTSIDCQSDMPTETIVANTDPVLLHVVVQNLFSNAVKYTGNKGTIRISLHQEADKVMLEVQDTGIGIPKRDCSQIFQRLFRARNAMKSVADGTGLGLYISHMIVDILGGSISFSSKENVGTTFILELPKAL